MGQIRIKDSGEREELGTCVAIPDATNISVATTSVALGAVASTRYSTYTSVRASKGHPSDMLSVPVYKYIDSSQASIVDWPACA